MDVSSGERPVALVTGASRGIGAACAVALARKGFDLAVAARTLREGEGRGPTSHAQGGEGPPLPGSLETTAARVEAEGRRCLPLRIDLLDHATLEVAVARTEAELGPIDLLVNNAIYQGPGHMDPFLETPLELLERPIRGNIIAPMVLLKLVLPGMLERGGGTVVQMTSSVAFLNPPGPVGKGGWGLAYGVSKGGFDRMAGVLNAELGERGIRVYNIEPGFVVSGVPLEEARRRFPGVPVTPPEAIGEAVAWLATDEGAPRLLGKLVHGPELCARKGLLPGWEGPS